MNKIRVALVEDEPSLREGLADLISNRPEFKFVGASDSAEAALRTLPKDPPDVVIMDINLPGMSGIDCITKLKPQLPQTLFVMLTMFDDTDRIFAALRAGASGYLLKRSAPVELPAAILQVHAGGSPMTPQIARQVVEFFQSQTKAAARPPAPLEGLTEREHELLSLLARGRQYKEISDQMGISTDTVRSHIRRIYGKLQVHSRTEAAAKFFSQ